MVPRRWISVGTMTLALAAATAARADDVVLVPNSTVKEATSQGIVRGTIQSESATDVVVKLGATTTKIPTDQIVSITYAGQPPSMALAETSESQGQTLKAIDLYKRAAADASGKPLIEQAAQFKAADLSADLALADPSRVNDAISLLTGFARTYPTSRHLASVNESLARLQLQKGDFAGVEATLGSLSKLPGGADRAAVFRARVLARKGEHAAAVTELDRLIKAAPEGSARQRDARLARAESLAGQKKYQEAEAEVRAVIKALPAEDAPGMAAAYNTLGDCLRHAGRPKDALLAYLHTDVLYARDKEQHPRALAQIIPLWRELKRDDRADETLARLKQDYPQSPWLSSPRAAP
ncbi:MAG: tetratricopeptide repeat protein [Planctomycetia bacterium]|nr:tetratricopeptide repeat protein [Planctomycetia bacterium]